MKAKPPAPRGDSGDRFHSLCLPSRTSCRSMSPTEKTVASSGVGTCSTASLILGTCLAAFLAVTASSGAPRIATAALFASTSRRSLCTHSRISSWNSVNSIVFLSWYNCSWRRAKRWISLVFDWADLFHYPDGPKNSRMKHACILSRPDGPVRPSG